MVQEGNGFQVKNGLMPLFVQNLFGKIIKNRIIILFRRNNFQWKEKIWRFEDPNDDGHFDKKSLFFEGLNTEVTGLAGGILFRDNAAYVTCIPDMLKITDTDGDGRGDKTEVLATGFGIHIGYGGHDMHGPTMGYDGRIYWTIGDKGFSVRSREGAVFHYPYHGGMFRCEPDGSNFEVFAHGLRNPQELAFDEYGNWFIVDNDGDFGDRERFHYLLEGTDTGWRATWQYRSNRKFAEHGGYNPWMADGLWKPHFDGQPAYITPAISNYSDGPCGFAYNPGTALNEKYQRHFFVTEFPGKNVRAFRTEPDGAGFKSYSYIDLGPAFQGWADSLLNPAGDTPLNYVDAIIVNEPGDDDLSLVVTGMVKTSPTVLPVDQLFTYVGTVYPTGSTLANSGLSGSLAADTTGAGGGDSVYIPKDDASGYTRYQFIDLGAAFSGWADNLLTPSDDVELTSGVVIDQNGTGEAYNAKTSAPDFYADL